MERMISEEKFVKLTGVPGTICIGRNHLGSSWLTPDHQILREKRVGGDRNPSWMHVIVEE